MIALTKCSTCRVPFKECLDCSGSMGIWMCPSCIEDSTIHCSHCNTAIDGRLPEPLDDGSFLCDKCNTKLLEELDEFTNNH